MDDNAGNNVQNNLSYNAENNVPNNMGYNSANDMPNNIQYNAGYNVGNNMGNPMPGQKKGKGGLIALWIVLGIVALVVIGIVIAIVAKNIAHENEIRPYQSKVEQYLYSKYNEEFDVKYIKDENAEVKAPCGNSTVSCGTTSNTRYYYFDAKSKRTNIELSVRLEERKDTGKESFEIDVK